MPTYTTLKQVTHISDSLLSDILESNIASFFQWGTLGVGGFYNVSITSSGEYGGNQSRLRMVTDPAYVDGQVWEGFRKDWVWESGVEYAQQPISISGVYVNGGFHPASGIGAYKHIVDYPHGRVVFDTAIPKTSQVNCEYSYRLYQFYTADVPWWQDIQPNSFRVDDNQFLQQGSGAWDILSEYRIQLPAVVVEAATRTSREGKQLGGGDIVYQDVLFHIMTEDRWHFKWLHDTITNQWQKRLNAYDKNKLLANDAFPINAYGSLKPSGLMYPDLVNPTGNYYWGQIRFDGRTSSQNQGNLGSINYCTVRSTVSTDLL